MRILLSHHAPWLGGTRTHLIDLAEELKRRRYETVVLTDGGILDAEMAARGISFKARPKDPDDLDRLYRRLVSGAHDWILHAHTRKAMSECFRLSLETGLPWVATIHGEYAADFEKSPPGYAMARSVRTVITVSEGIRDYLAEHSAVPPEKTRVIRNGINTKEYSPNPPGPGRKAVGINPGAFALMYLGRLDSDKGPAVRASARAACILRDWGIDCRGVLVGGGDLFGEMEAFNRQQAENTGGAPLALTGTRRDLPALISSCDVVVAAGRSALEAMAAGKPVIAAGHAGCFGLVTPERWEAACASNFGDHGQWPEPSAVAVADQAHRFVYDRDYARRLGGQLRELVIRDYDIRGMVDRLEAVYHEAANSHA